VIKRFTILAFFFCTLLNAQEVVSPLSNNPFQIIHAEKQKKQSAVTRFLMAPGDTLLLPFIDDFSSTFIYPDSTKWLDKKVYINRDFPIAPITIGVATFDGLSETGCPYDTVSTNGNINLKSDSLTSKPIKLDYQPSDSIYISFYYQAKGRGDKPELDDSLLLYFKNASSGAWKKVWGRGGLINNSQADSVFRRVMIAITDTAYLKNGFQFRFINKSARLGNIDHWHIDYVQLKNASFKADTLINDVAFVYTPSSYLKNFQAMPWKQYNASEMTDSLWNFVRNNHTAFLNTNYTYKVFNQLQTQLLSANGSGNIEPFFTSGYTTCLIPSTGCRPLLRPPLNSFQFPALTGNTYFTLEHVINASGDINLKNDTIRRRQDFINYYAYDDGTAELAYGLNVIGSKLAYKFTLNVQDTLRAVDMYFNWINNMLSSPPVNSITQRQFRITIWNNNNGIPGAIIYQDSIVTPAYEFEYYTDWGNLSNKFYKYVLTSPQVLNTGTFFVGWVQYTDDLLNIGLDLNTNANTSKLFYNTLGNWSQSAIQGSVMIRPVFGTNGETAGEEDQAQVQKNVWKVFPNPANDFIQIKIDEVLTPSAISITDEVGREIYTSAYLTDIKINTADFTNGIYLVRLLLADGSQSVKKLIIAR
jgi:hypothetical protein